MPFAAEAFGALGEVRVLAPREITAAALRDVELLLIRSTVRVDETLLTGTRVRFVGTATIGTDHLDAAYLDRAGIAWRAAPGCNANSVAEYVATALLCLARRQGLTLAGKTLGVIGVGNVGQRVARVAEALGLRVLQNDPPRYDATGDPDLRLLDEVLERAEIVTLHVPLTWDGAHPTRHLAGNCFFKRLKRGAVFLNAARGAVTDTDALLAALGRGSVAHAVIDCWEGEPAFRTDLLARVALGTPHIAGHSFEGKALGTVMVYREACRWLGVAPTWTPDAAWPPPPVPAIALDAAACGDGSDEAVLWELARRVYDIEADDRRLREAAAEDAAARGAAFERQRKDYPLRREFRFTRVALQQARPGLIEKARRLGFAVDA